MWEDRLIRYTVNFIGAMLPFLILFMLLGLPAILNPANALDLPPPPTEWKVNQQIHVKITGLSVDDKIEAINYIKSKIEPLDLDISLVFDDNVKRPDGLSEGISISYVPISGECYGTRQITGYTQGFTEAIGLQSIKIGRDCYGGHRELNDIYWHNILLHEFNHALYMDHLFAIRNIPLPLMYKNASTTELLWTFADQWQLKRKYSRHKVLNYRRINFKEKTIGKYCYLIKGAKSVQFPIELQSELLPFLDKLNSYRRVVR